MSFGLLVVLEPAPALMKDFATLESPRVTKFTDRLCLVDVLNKNFPWAVLLSLFSKGL